MTRIVVSRQALQDVRQILGDLHHKAGPDIAERYAASFKLVYRSITEFPGLGPARPALGAVARIRLVHPYVVVYDFADDTATVLRVLHGRRKITASLARE